VTAGVNNDSFVDTPTQYGTDTGVGGEVRGNYCTMNPLDGVGTATFSNGNLDFVNSADAVFRGTFGIPPNSGKWYWEFTQLTAVSSGAPSNYGIGSMTGAPSHSTPVKQVTYINAGGTETYGIAYVGGTASYSLRYVATDVEINETLQVAYDSDTGKLWFGKGNVWSDASVGTTGNPVTGANPTFTIAVDGQTMTPIIDHAGVTFKVALNCGQRAFVNTAPSGFKALCTTNLPTPTIGATAATQANKFFNSVTYTGAGGTQAVNVGFQPDFVWMKSRSATGSHILQNAVTGVTKGLQSESTSSEFTDATTLTEFNSAGFKASGNSQTNGSGTTYVAWNWRASNAAAVTNTSGSITSQVSANPTAGFSIVSYVGVVSDPVTIGHGLGVAPNFIMVKNRSTTSAWYVYHSALGPTYRTSLNTNAASFSGTGLWNGTAPTSTVFSTVADTTTNNTGSNHIAYCFAAVAGYSAFGTYTGNGSVNGPFVYLGFRPAFILIKTTNALGYWLILDVARNTVNSMTAQLWPNGADAENNDYGILDANSNGFKLRNITAGDNDNGTVYMYMAFASNPFKYSLAR
jgi:hypothetical protein